jgi:hypothetical protein
MFQQPFRTLPADVTFTTFDGMSSVFEAAQLLRDRVNF